MGKVQTPINSENYTPLSEPFRTYLHCYINKQVQFLMRGRVCLLYVPLALARAVFVGSETLGTRDHILLSQIWDFPFRRLLLLAWSRWRYWTPPPQEYMCLLWICIVFLNRASTVIILFIFMSTVSIIEFIYLCCKFLFVLWGYFCLTKADYRLIRMTSSPITPD
jgi:hypothetical protein